MFIESEENVLVTAVDRPVFVVGTPRSGTTLTAKILGRNSCLFMPGETHFFDDIYSMRNQIGQPGEKGASVRIAERLYTLYDRYYESEDQIRIEEIYKNVNQLAEDIDSAADYGDVFSRFMCKQASYVNKSRWGNNAPRDIFNINEILSFYPDAKIVVCVRDVRAFLLSYKGKWKITGDEHVERLKKLYHPVVTSYLWKSSMRQLNNIRDKVSDDNLCIIKYEDLVTEPENTVNTLCEKLEISYESSMLEVVTHNSSNSPAGNGIFSSSIDKWKEDLSAEEIVISQKIACEELKILNYKELNLQSSLPKQLFIWFMAIFALARALHANRDTRGPLVPYLFKRVTSLVRNY